MLTSGLASSKTDPGYFTETQYPMQVKCLPGTYSFGYVDTATTPSTVCDQCDPGHFCDTAGLSDGDMTTNACPAGHDCSASGTIYPNACRPGQYTTDPSLACTDADEDTFVTTYAIDATTPCASGYKCI